MQKQLGIPDDAHWALVSLTTTASPDDVIAVASSRDCSGVFNVGTKFTGGRGGHFAGGEWRTDATHNQIAAITNVGTQVADALVTLHYDRGTKKYELEEQVAPGEQMWVNLEQLARQQLPDRNGSFLPSDVSAVTYDVQDPTPGGHSLMANDLAVNTAMGQAVPACPTCCGYSDVFFDPSVAQVVIDEFLGLGVEAINACSGAQSNIDPFMTDWFSSNANIAAVTPERVQGASVGSATAFAQGNVQVYGGPCGCFYERLEPSAPVTVTPTLVVQGNQYNSIFVGTDSHLSTANTFLASATPAEGTFTETSPASSDKFTAVQSGGPGWVVTTTTQSTKAADRILTFSYLVNGVKATKSLNVTARQFAYVANNSPTNTCTLGYGTVRVYLYTPYTHPDKTAVQTGIGLSGTPATESFNPQPPSGAQTGSGALDGNSQFTDRISYCSTAPLTITSTITQTLAIEGFTVRTNTLNFSSSGVTYTSQGPTQ
jgi:hypothetical protein